MKIKRRRYGIEKESAQILTDSQSKMHLKTEAGEGKAVWVEGMDHMLNSTMGSGGAELHIYRQRRRWERNREWEEKQIKEANQEQQEYETNKERVNAILESKTAKKRNKRLKKKMKRKMLKEQKRGEQKKEEEGAIVDSKVNNKD